jgi:hypothetical protein
MGFAIIVNFGEEEMFIARQNPNKLNFKTTSAIYYDVGRIINYEIPIDELLPNSNTKLLHEILESKLGIGEYTNKAQGNTRDSLSVSFSHSRLFCFQPQDLIAQKSSLFYNQNSKDGGYVKQAIIDTLPYFLGAVREDVLKIERKISSLKKELRKLRRQLTDAENIRDKGNAKLFDLLEEAKEVELVDSKVSYEDEEPKALIPILSKLLEGNHEEKYISGKNNVLNNLIKEKSDLRRNLEKVEEEIYAAKSFIKDLEGYDQEIKEQEQRLEFINLYKEVEEGKYWNSLIGIEVDYIPPTIENINHSLSKLRKQLLSTTKEKPKFSKYINELETNKSKLKERISSINSSINAIYKQQKEVNKIKDLNVKKGIVLGRISLFLESIDITDQYSKLHNQIKTKESQLEELQSLISIEEKDDRMSAILNKINLQMSQWVPLLDIEEEYKKCLTRFNAKDLTLYVDTVKKTIPLSQLGSGANHVSYHLLVLFGLHKHFVQEGRPVPRFLMLDQPSQVYYPPEKDSEYKGNLRSSDEIAVKQLFDFVFSATETMQGHFQVIVTDHAMLRYDKFEAAVVETWRNGAKLVPLAWDEQDDMTHL